MWKCKNCKEKNINSFVECYKCKSLKPEKAISNWTDKLKWLSILAAAATLLGLLINIYDMSQKEYLNYRRKASLLEEVMAQAEKELRKKYTGWDGIPTKPFVIPERKDGYDLSYRIGYEMPEKINVDDIDRFHATITGYKSGSYDVKDSPQAIIILSSLKTAIRGTLTQYVSGRGVDIKSRLSGMADGAKFLKGSYYKGDLGTLRNYPYFSKNDNTFKYMNLIPYQSHLDNQSLAFLRAYSVYKNLLEIEEMRHAKVMLVTEEVPKRGSKYRRVLIEIQIKNALKDDFEELNPIQKEMMNIMNW